MLGLAVPVAGAQTPSQSGYGETQVLPASSTPSAGAPADKSGSVAANSTSSLPFTGLEVGLVALAALALLAVGVGLRRATSTRPPV